MRIAHVILAHSRPAQLARLTSALTEAGDLAFVHIDKRQPVEPFAAALAPDGVELLPRVATPWGGWGLVEASLIGLRAAVRHADYVCLLSGQDYPITTRARMVARLDGGVFLETFGLPAPGFPDGGGLDRLERWYLRPGRRWSLPNRFVPFWPRRRLPGGLVPYGGKQFWCLPADAGAWLCEETDRRPEVVRFFRRSFVADEHFVQTLMRNGPFAERIVDDDLRCIMHDHGEAHPRLLGPADFDALAASGDLFARKFDAERDPSLLDRIDAELRR